MGKRTQSVVYIIVILGIASRLICFGSIPGGIQQDEAFAAYESYCLLYDGMDSWGYVHPVYLVTWGSGMNVLLSVLMMPWVYCMGLTVVAARIPMLIVSCLTLPAFYGCMKRLFDERTGVIALFLLAISPWHYMLSRWSLESNLAPAFLIFGLYFFLKGMEKTPFFLASGFFYGLCLYCYALTWITVPLILGQMIYIYWRKEKPCIDRYMILSVVILMVLAMPLILFVLINQGILPEIKSGFLSIPRLKGQRLNEFSLIKIPQNIRNTLYILWHQADSEAQNGTRQFGLYYHVSVVFILIGAGNLLYRVKHHTGARILLAQVVACLPVCILTTTMVQRMNAIHIPVIGICAVGIDTVCKLFRTNQKKALAVMVAGYGILFGLFLNYYFTDYNDLISIAFQNGLPEAMIRAREIAGENSVEVNGIFFSRILFYEQLNPEVYRTTVRWPAESAFMTPESFQGWHFSQTDESSVVISDIATSYELRFAEYKREEYGWIAVLIPPAGDE